MQNQNYIVIESLNMQFKIKRMAMKITIIITNMMMKIIVRWNSIKQIVTGAHIT